MGLGPQKYNSNLLSFREFLQTWLIPRGDPGELAIARLDIDPELPGVESETPVVGEGISPGSGQHRHPT